MDYAVVELAVDPLEAFAPFLGSCREVCPDLAAT
jgi:hypothetical protein